MPKNLDTTTPTEEATPETDPPRDLAAEVEKWKALSRKNEQRAKDNATKALEYDKIQEAAKTEQERLQDQLSQAQAALAERDATLARLEAVRKHGLSDADSAILAVVPADKIEEVATQLAAKAETVAEAERQAGNRNLAAHFGAGTPIPTEPDNATNPGINGLVRAVRS